MRDVKIFLSAVTDEFGPYRDALRSELTLPNVEVKIQENFIPTGTETLDKLDRYVLACDVVIHLVGSRTGSVPRPESVAGTIEKYPRLRELLGTGGEERSGVGNWFSACGVLGCELGAEWHLAASRAGQDAAQPGEPR